MKMDFSYLTGGRRIIVAGPAGSRLYRLNKPESDDDTRGIVLDRTDDIIDIEGVQNQELSDDSQDTKFYGLYKFLHLAAGCNPNIIELLYLPKDVIYESSKEYEELLKIRHLFITKRARFTFGAYANAQIKRARGKGKKGNDIDKYVNAAGLEKLRMWLTYEPGELPISKLFNGSSCILYTFGHFMRDYLHKLPPFVWTPELMEEYKDFDWHNDPDIVKMKPPRRVDYIQWLRTDEHGFPFRPVPFSANPDILVASTAKDASKYDAAQVEGFSNLYRLYHNGTGFMAPDQMQVVCHSISKERERMDFAGIAKIDVEGYEKAKREYDSFWEWMSQRNENRYTKDWDSNAQVDFKNLMHTMRLLICAKNIAVNGEPIIRFDGEQRDYLMSIRNGEIKYEKILETAEEMIQEIDVLFEKSSLPDHADMPRIKQFYREIFKQALLEEIKNGSSN